MAYFAHKPDMVEGATVAILKACEQVPDDDFALIAERLLEEMGPNPWQPPVPGAFLAQYNRLLAARGAPVIEPPAPPRTPGKEEILREVASLTSLKGIEATLAIARLGLKHHPQSDVLCEVERLCLAMKKEFHEIGFSPRNPLMIPQDVVRQTEPLAKKIEAQVAPVGAPPALVEEEF
jgi:hypothetical protein